VDPSGYRRIQIGRAYTAMELPEFQRPAHHLPQEAAFSVQAPNRPNMKYPRGARKWNYSMATIILFNSCG
jgi:hypothetical protein